MKKYLATDWTSLIIMGVVIKKVWVLQEIRHPLFLYPPTKSTSGLGCLYSVEWNGGMEWWNGMVE